MHKSLGLVFLFSSQLVLAQGFESLAGLFPGIPSFSEEVGRGMIQSEIMKQLETQSRAMSTGPVVSPSCTATPTITDFFDTRSIAKSEASAAVNAALLQKADPTLPELWSILRSTGMGTAILKKFQPKYGYEIRVIFADPRKEGKENSAAIYRPNDKTIVVQRNRQAGEIAFVLLHEMVHALDSDYRRALEKEKELRGVFKANLERNLSARTKLAAKTPQARRPPEPVSIKELARQYEILRQFRDLRIYRAERFAYDASFDAWTELSRLYPSYYQGRGLAGQPVRYSDEWLEKVLGIRREYVEKFKKGECKTVQNFDS